jgi:hypothetical protein
LRQPVAANHRIEMWCESGKVLEKARLQSVQSRRHLNRSIPFDAQSRHRFVGIDYVEYDNEIRRLAIERLRKSADPPFSRAGRREDANRLGKGVMAQIFVCIMEVA